MPHIYKRHIHTYTHTHLESRKKLSLATCCVWYSTFRVGGAAVAAAVAAAPASAFAIIAVAGIIDRPPNEPISRSINP